MEIFLLYLWTRLDIFHDTMSFIMGAFCIGILVSTLVWFINDGIYEDKAANAKKLLFSIVKWSLLPMTLVMLVPSQKDAAIIAGGWAVKEIATSDKAQELANKTYQLINGKLDEELDNLKKEAKQ